MNYDLKLERQILEAIYDFPHDLNSPGDPFTPVYPESIQFLPALNRYESFGSDGQWRLFESHLRQMRMRGWIEGQEWKDCWGPQNLTDAGYARLEWFRDNSLLKQTQRFLSGLVEKALTSIVLPIAVTILTVIIMRYFEINELPSP